MDIHAWAALGPKQDLTSFTYNKDIGDDDVLIRIKYCTLLKADTFFVDNFWLDSTYPLVPGTESFGTVVQIGKNVKNLKAGDYVGVGYQVYSCLKCEYCLQGKEQLCQKQRVLCVHEYGGLSDYMIVNFNFAYLIPPKLQQPQFVPLMGYGITAFSAVTHARLTPGMTVGVIGVGNLGYLATQILVKSGMNLTAFTHSADKAKNLQKLGIKKFINPLDADELSKNKNTYDFLLMTTYHPYNWPLIISLLKPEGALCFLGLPKENISFPAGLLADYARRNITGSYIGSRQDMIDLLQLAQTHDIKANIQLYSPADIHTVFNRLRQDALTATSVLQMI